MAVYLSLLTGREHPEDGPEDSDFEEGPILGPLEWVHQTYFTDLSCQPEWKLNDEAWFNIVEDMIEYGGKYYGDFEVMDLAGVKALEYGVERIEQVDPNLVNKTP